MGNADLHCSSYRLVMKAITQVVEYAWHEDTVGILGC
jgi:hypothetical protein